MTQDNERIAEDIAGVRINFGAEVAERLLASGIDLPDEIRVAARSMVEAHAVWSQDIAELRRLEGGNEGGG